MIIFVSNLEFHGVTTFTIRLCKQLANSGKKPAVVVIYRSDDLRLKEQLTKYADIFYLKDYFRFRAFPEIYHFNAFRSIDIKKLQNDIFSKYGAAVHVTGILGLVLAFNVAQEISNIKISVGIYHQREFLYSFSRIDFFSRYIIQKFSQLRPEQVLFFNEHTRDAYAENFNKTWNSSLVLPIGVELPSLLDGSKRKYQFGKIVSVGQLLPFKTYNEAIMRTLASLQNDFPQLQYYIYGDGEERHRLERLSRELGLEQKVFFCGTIKYELFQSAVADAHVFVGSGTAILEAAILGVPSIIGIEGNKKLDTYGFISDVPGYTYNEDIAYLSRLSFADCLLKVLYNDGEHSEEIGKSCMKKAKTFSISTTVDGFNQSIQKIGNSNRLSFSKCWGLITFLFVAILDRLKLDQGYRTRRNQ